MKKNLIKLTSGSGVEETIPVSNIAHVVANGSGVNVEDVSGTISEYAEGYSYVKKLLRRTARLSFLELTTSSGDYLVNKNHVVYVKKGGSDVAVVEMKDSGYLTASSENWEHFVGRMKAKDIPLFPITDTSVVYYVNPYAIANVYGSGTPFVANLVLDNEETLTDDAQLYSYVLRRLSSIGVRGFGKAEDITGFGDVMFTVKNSNAEVIAGATVTFSGVSKQTDGSGIASFPNVDNGTNKPYTVSKEGWVTATGTQTVNSDSTTPEVTLTSTQTDFLTFDIYNNTIALGGTSIKTGAATIDAVNHSVAIEVVAGTDLAVDTIVPMFTLSYGATNNVITNDVAYGDFVDGTPTVVTVTAEDGVTTQAWDVTVSVAV
jgi:hypothetical protein